MSVISVVMMVKVICQLHGCCRSNELNDVDELILNELTESNELNAPADRLSK